MATNDAGMMRHRLIALALAATGLACSEKAQLPLESGMGPSPTLPAPRQDAGPDGADRARRSAGPAERQADRLGAAWTVNIGFATNLPAPALAARVAQRRRADLRRNRNAPKPEDAKGVARLVVQAIDGRRRARRGAERRPHHAAARRRRRRRGRDAHGVHRRACTRRSAWRSSTATSTSPTRTRSSAFPYHSPARRASTTPPVRLGRTCPAGPSATTTGPRA